MLTSLANQVVKINRRKRANNKYLTYIFLIFVIIAGFATYNFDENIQSDNSIKDEKSLLISPIVDKEPVVVVIKGDAELEPESNPVIDLTSKEKSDSDHFKKIEKTGKDAKKAIENGEIEVEAEMMDNMKNIIFASMQGEWDKFRDAADYFEEMDSGMLDFTLYHAVMNNAPFDLIRGLIAKGANFLPGVTGMLALRDNLPMIKQLVPLGLDLHGVDEQGKNALNHALTVISDKATFDYLLANNVSPNINTPVLDPLDAALQHLIINEEAFYYVDKLLSYGAKAGLSHRQLLDKIRDENPNAYQRLKESQSEIFN